MNLDLRVPIGLFFITIGLIMGIFGFVSSPAMYEKSLGINMNLYWGIVELIFGSLMLAFGRAHRDVVAPAIVVVPASSAKAATARHDLPPPETKPKPKPPVAHG